MSATTFHICEIPGEGAHATVCLARRSEDTPLLALKVLKGEFDAESAEAARVRDEGVLLATLKHPNIVRLEERLTVQGREILVMECVEGPPVRDLVRKLGRLPVWVALEVMHSIASALEYAFHHEYQGRPLQLVHRDLNLNNVLISVTGQVKLLDYGLAKASFDGREANTLVSLQGTAGYVPPEGLHDHPSLDVYAVGVCLLYMLSGHLPVLSHQRVGHAAGMSEHLAWMRKTLEGDGVEPDMVKALDKLVRDLCAFDLRERPKITEVVEWVQRLAPERKDLSAWATEHVVPVYAERERIEPHRHPSWRELAFLEIADDLEDDPTEVVDIDNLIRQFLRRPHWQLDADELEDLLNANPTWTARPYLDYLARTDKPWWNPFAKAPTAAGTREALRLVAGRPGKDVTLRASRLRLHPDKGVREIAKAIVAGRPLPRRE